MPTEIWSVRALTKVFGAYMIALGAAFFFGGEDSLQGPNFYSFRQIANSIGASTHILMATLLVLPGVLVFFRQTRRAGLILAVGVFAMITVAFAHAALVSTQAVLTAPVTYAFATILAAWLHSMTRAFR